MEQRLVKTESVAAEAGVVAEAGSRVAKRAYVAPECVRVSARDTAEGPTIGSDAADAGS